MAFAPDNSSLSSDQDTNRFLVQAEIELQISYSTIKEFTNYANWKSTKTLKSLIKGLNILKKKKTLRGFDDKEH